MKKRYRNDSGTRPDWESRLSGRPFIKSGFTSELEQKVRDRVRMENRERPRRAYLRPVAAFALVCLLAAGGMMLRDVWKRPHNIPAYAADAPAALRSDPLAEEGDIELKVYSQYYHDMQSFMSFAGNPFVIRHPGVRFTLLQPPGEGSSDNQGKLEQWLVEQKPDVIIADSLLFRKLARGGQLQPLDARIKDDKFDLDGIFGPVTDLLRGLGGDGQLYGLANTFSTSAIYVNKELFARHGIPLPEDGMTWDEVLALAQRFDGTGTAGLAGPETGNPFSLVQMAGRAEGLQPFGTESRQATAESPAWAALWSKVADGVRQGWIYNGPDPLTGKSFTMKQAAAADPFLNGKAAMLVRPSYYTYYLTEGMRQSGKNLDWITVTAPVGKARPDVSAEFRLDTVYAVNAKSANPKAAWEFVKFNAGAEMARRMNNSRPYDLLAREAELKWLEPQRKDAFYKLKGDPESYAKERADDPVSVSGYGAFYQDGRRLMAEVAAGKLPVEKALGQLQANVQKALDHAAQKEPEGG